MSAARDVLAGVGAAAAAVGLLLVVRPSFATSLGVPRTSLLLLGGIAAVEGIRSIRRRRGAEIRGATPPDPEARAATPAPGDGFDALVARLGARRESEWTGGNYDRVRKRLRNAAAAAVAARDGIAREAARERVEAGEWTDDPVAAFFLGDDDVPPPPFRVRLEAILSARPRYQLYATRTADEIAAVAGVV